MSFSFEPARKPFARWMGPFSPARGARSGFRFHEGSLGTWVQDATGSAFWSATPTAGAEKLRKLVADNWGGGRVLLLPNGLVIKPLPGKDDDEDVGKRVVIGRFEGALVLTRPDGSKFDMSKPKSLDPGDAWPGPVTTGLECAMQPDGSLVCSWYHPTRLGRDESRETIRGSDAKLYAAFRKARPDDTGGRVRVTLHGHVITNRQTADAWRAYYVGRATPASLLGDWDDWIKENKT